MAVRPVLAYPATSLRLVCEPMSLPAGDVARDLAQDLLDTLAHYKGAGLAAPQIGALTRMFALSAEVAGAAIVVANPKITARSKATASFMEGCLSVPGAPIPVERAATISAEFWVWNPHHDAWNRHTWTDVVGLAAVAFQHEFEHLAGKMMFDKIKDKNRRLRYLRDRGIAE